MTLHYRTHASPIGELLLVANATALLRLHIKQGKYVPEAHSDWLHGPDHPVINLALSELDAYFTGKLRAFSVPVAGLGTVFQQRVWAALSSIPYGETRSYGEQAISIERPSAVRAVGAANGRNPISIIVPCHRVIGKGGALTGYAGGLDTKRFLLALEAQCIGASAHKQSLTAAADR